MNCKPGDLAVIVHTYPETSSVLGLPVRLTTSVVFNGDFCWNYEGMPLKGRVGRNFWTWHELPDAWLRPIRPNGITDEEVRDLYAPNRDEVTA